MLFAAHVWVAHLPWQDLVLILQRLGGPEAVVKLVRLSHGFVQGIALVAEVSKPLIHGIGHFGDLLSRVIHHLVASGLCWTGHGLKN